MDETQQPENEETMVEEEAIGPLMQAKLPSPQERLELILMGLIREQTVETLCEEAGVSRALFYQWLRRAKQGLLEALEAKKPGRKPLQKLQEDPEALTLLQEKLKVQEEEIEELRRDRDRYKKLTEVAQRVIRRSGWNPGPMRRGRKKKDTQMTPPDGGMLRAGPDNGTSPQPAITPASGASAEARTGGGLEG